MGGRGMFSYQGQPKPASSKPLTAFAVGSLNKGISKGTSQKDAIDRFRGQLMEEKVEYSAYIDDQGFIHSLGSTGVEGSTKIAPLEAVVNEKGISAIIHNHPYGTSDGGKWGGPFSEADLGHISGVYDLSNGKVNKIIATSKEGVYTAIVKKHVSQKSVVDAAAGADASVAGKKFRSEKAMWKAVNKAYATEFAKIGIDITFTPQRKKKSELITQKIGTY